MTSTELIQRVTAYVQANFAGDWAKAFAHYARDESGRLGLRELVQLMKDVGINSDWTREKYARAIIRAMDLSGDGRVSWEEFQAVFEER